MTTIHPSSFPLAAHCAPSLWPEVQIETGDGDAADLGTAGHDVLAEWITRGSQRWGAVAQAAARYGVDMDELHDLACWGWHCWGDLKQHYTHAIAEKRYTWHDEVSGFTLSGQLDVLHLDSWSPAAVEARVLDHKSGRVDADATEQVKGYGLLVCKEFPKVERVHLGVIRWRSRRFDGFWITRQDLEGWWSEFSARLLRGRETFRPGRWCGYCKRGPTCPAKEALLQQAGAMVSTWRGDVAAIGQVYDALKLLEGWTKGAKELVRAEVIAAGGKLPLGDGRQLEINEQKVRELDYRKAEPVLIGEIGVDKLKEISKLGVTAVEAAVGSQHGRGRKGAAIKDVMGRLEGAGAVGYRVIEKLVAKEVGDVSTDDAATIPAIAGPAVE